VARDNVDELLLQDAHNMRKPLLGICYGLQSLNVWRTGTLVQHIESDVVHTRPKGAAKSQQIVHEAIVEPASELGRIVASALEGEASTVEVNSSHHQAVDVAGDGLSVVARSKEDGVIEALESMSDDHWVMGVQWHPERMTDAVSKALFAELVRQARAWHESMAGSKGDFESVR
jgi:putative glutamine amidotransferase